MKNHPVIEMLNNLIVGYQLIVDRSDKPGFIEFRAKPNGQISMRMDDGAISAVMTRDQVLNVFQDFELEAKIALPITTTLIDSAGRFVEPTTAATSGNAQKDKTINPAAAPTREQLESHIQNAFNGRYQTRSSNNEIAIDFGGGSELIINFTDSEILDLSIYTERIPASSAFWHHLRLTQNPNLNLANIIPVFPGTYDYQQSPDGGIAVSVRIPNLQFVPVHLTIAIEHAITTFNRLKPLQSDI